VSLEDPLPANGASSQERPESISIGTRSAWLRTAGTVEGEDDPALARLRTVRLKPLGEGGQGRVFLVEHLGQLEAHKVLRRRGTDRSVFREALHTRLVEHPNIVKVFGTEEVEGNWVLRMEYVEGRDLARVVEEEGCLSVGEVLPYARQVAEALAAAHERGIVHQDLKPSNLILRDDRSAVVVTDFGVSAALRSHVSGAGGRGGTPIFMAPELLEGRTNGTPRTDVWSLGVTLFFLVTGTYPFPFDELSPVEAVRRDPRDPRDECPHVSAAFWSILQRALSRDPDRGFESMDALAAALVAFDERLECPACGHSIVKDEARERCPRPECRSAAAGRAVRRAAALGAAEDALVQCRFEAAREAADRALELGAPDDVDARNEARRLRDAATDHAARHARVCADVTDCLENLRLVRCLATLDASRTRFSRSQDLRLLRERLVQALVEVQESTESLATDALRGGDFDRARESLTRLREICDDPAARKALERALGGPADDLAWLGEEVDRKEAIFAELSNETRAAIDAFEFEAALRTLARLENEFPAEQNVELLERLRRAQDAYAIARRIDDVHLREIAADPLARSAEGPLELSAAASACSQLLADFSRDEYPGFRVIAERRETLAAAARAIELRVEEARETARRLEDDRRLSAALAELRRVRPLVVDSDLFGPGPRDDLERRIARLDERLERASRLHRDGVRARERREFAQAALSWREVGQLAPHDFADVGQELSELATLRDKVSALSERVTREFADLRRGRLALETAELSFEHAQALYELADDSRRERLIEDAAKTLYVLLNARLETIARDAGAGSAAVDVDASLDPFARGFASERWSELFAAVPELPAAVAAVARAAIERVPDELERLLDEAGRLIPALAGVREPLTHPASGGEDDHPSTALAARIEAAFTAAPRHRKRDLRAVALERVRALVELAPPALQPTLRRSVDRLRREGARARLRRAGRLTARAIAFTTPLVLVGWLAWTTGRDSGVRAKERDTRQLFASWLVPLALDDAAQAQAHRWFGYDPVTDEFGAPTPERVALVEEWAELRGALGGGTSDDEIASWLALGRARRRNLLLGPSRDALLAAFDADVAAAVERRLASAFELALADVESDVRSAATAEHGLIVELERLEGSLPEETAAYRRVASLRRGVQTFVEDFVATELARELAGGDLESAVRQTIGPLLEQADASGEAADPIERAAARYRIAHVRRFLWTSLSDLAYRGALGEVDDLSARVDALLRALEAVPTGTQRTPDFGDRPGAAAVERVHAILRPEPR